MNKKIVTELVVGTIFIIAIFVGLEILILGKQEIKTSLINNQIQQKKSTSTTNTDIRSSKAIWLEYNNQTIGVQFHYPKEIYPQYLIKCNKPMPIEIYEETQKYNEKSNYSVISVGTKHPFNEEGCEQLSFSIGYSIYVGNVNNTNELNQFIKKIYGSECKLEIEKDMGETRYTIDIGKFDSETGYPCTISGKGGLWEYSPEKKRAILFQTGQEQQFGRQLNEYLDEEFFTSIHLN